MIKLQPETVRELKNIAGGTAICTAAMWVLFAALHIVGLAPFNAAVVLGGLVGAAVAVGNFAGICVMAEKAVNEPDEKRRKMIIQLSYNRRMLMQAVWVVVAIAAPCFQFVAGIAPLIFPRVAIYYLQITGHYKPAPKAPVEEVSVVEDETAPAAEDAALPRGEGGEI